VTAREHTVWELLCDAAGGAGFCGSRYHPPKDAPFTVRLRLRKLAAEDGWVYVPGSRTRNGIGKDFCPLHSSLAEGAGQ